MTVERIVFIAAGSFFTLSGFKSITLTLLAMAHRICRPQFIPKWLHQFLPIGYHTKESRHTYRIPKSGGR